MNIFEITYQKESLLQGTVKRERIAKQIALPTSVEEITLLQWCRYHELREGYKDLLQVFEGGEQNPAVADWFRFFEFCAKAVAIFANDEADAEEVLLSASADAASADSLVSMYVGCAAPLLSYEPKERTHFQHGRYTYMIPETVKQSFGSVLVGGKMSVAQAVDALQIEHALSGVDSEGKALMPDQRYHKDIYITAALCRRVDRDGSLEIPPIDFVERREWLDGRVEEFKNLSMDKALDVVFFLKDLKRQSKHTLLSALRSRISLVRQVQEKLYRQTNQSGKSGDGTAYM